MSQSISEATLSLIHRLRMPGMAQEYRNQQSDPNIGLVPVEERFFRLLTAEVDTRAERKFQKLLKLAHLRYPGASIDEKILDPSRCSSPDTVKRLSTSTEWIQQGNSLIITGQAGSGKSSLACALGISAMVKHCPVLYKRAGRLLDELCQAENSGTLQNLIQDLEKYDVLIIDDFGVMDLTMPRCRGLLELAEARDGKKTTIYVSPVPVEEWYDMFPEAKYADACMDRILHRAYRLEMMGESLRRRTPDEEDSHEQSAS